MNVGLIHKQHVYLMSDGKRYLYKRNVKRVIKHLHWGKTDEKGDDIPYKIIILMLEFTITHVHACIMKT